MGIRSVNNIKIVKNASQTVNTVEKKNQAEPIFNLDMSRVIQPDLSLYDKKAETFSAFVNIPEDDLAIYKEVCLEGKKVFAPHYSSLKDFLIASCEMITGFFNVYHSSRETEILAPILMKMGLLKELNGAYISTPKGDTFNNVFADLTETLPFDWDNFVDDGFDKDVFSLFSPDEDLVQINIDSKQYVLGVNLWSEESPRTTVDPNYRRSNLYLNPNPEIKGNKRITSTDQAFLNKVKNRRIMKSIIDGTRVDIKNSQLEMVPVAISQKDSLLQGSFDNKPIFVSLDNDFLKYCRNVYGKDLRFILGYPNNLDFSTSSKLHVINKENEVVASVCSIPDIPDGGPPWRARLSSLAYNMNRLRGLK